MDTENSNNEYDGYFMKDPYYPCPTPEMREEWSRIYKNKNISKRHKIIEFIIGFIERHSFR